MSNRTPITRLHALREGIRATSGALGTAAASAMLALAILAAPGATRPAAAAPVGTAFTYQARILDAGNPANGNYDLEFRLFDAEAAGTQIGTPLLLAGQALTNGVVGTTLDFGATAFTSDSERWLEITVVRGSDGTRTVLPRQKIQGVPYAQYATRAGAADSAWSLFGNAAGSGSFIGTTNSEALELRVNGARVLRVEPGTTTANHIGGSPANAIVPQFGGTLSGVTIAGGGVAGNDPFTNTPDNNVVTADFGTVSGGKGNQAGLGASVAGGRQNSANAVAGRDGFIGGGYVNVVSSEGGVIGGGTLNEVTGDFGFVGGGFRNKASSETATVAGGRDNVASSNNAAVLAGSGNTASGNGAVTVGGLNNSAESTTSFAAGYNAHSRHSGAFVLADLSEPEFASTRENEFSVRATGGTRIVTAVNPTTGAPTAGVTLNPGDGAWSTLSDRNAKENIKALDTRAVLERLLRVPVSQWNLKAQSPAVQHVGPMAQDFYAAFGLGVDERHINSSDADGVAFAAIQGLAGMVQEQRQQLDTLKKQNDNLQARLAALEAALKAAAPAAAPAAR